MACAAVFQFAEHRGALCRLDSGDMPGFHMAGMERGAEAHGRLQGILAAGVVA